MLDLVLISTLGFLGSFGHCAGMCGPLAIAFSLSQSTPNQKIAALRFHLLLNFGRILAYTIVGAAIGGLGSVLIASGQMAGSGSGLRRGIALFTGIILVWFGLLQVKPNLLPRLPMFHPLSHQRIQAAMLQVSAQKSWWMPTVLGLLWGLIPCGFLYAAQIKAAETGNMISGAVTMLAFGLGTLPTMLGVGVFASRLSAEKSSQLFRIGGWVTIAIGVLTLLRTDEMVDLTAHASLLCLMLALIARPISKFWPQPLRYRRALGVGGFVLGIAHCLHAIDHALRWNFEVVFFMLPLHQLGIATGVIGLMLMLPAAITSCDRLQNYLGKWWRQIHLLTVPAFLLCAIHAIAIGSHYLGGFEWTVQNKLLTVLLCAMVCVILLVRIGQVWTILSLDKFYVVPRK